MKTFSPISLAASLKGKKYDSSYFLLSPEGLRRPGSKQEVSTFFPLS